MFKNIKIGTKLGIGFGTLLLLLAGTALLGLVRLADIVDSMNTITQDRFPKTVWSNDLVNAANDSRAAIRNLLLTNNGKESKTLVDRINQNRVTMRDLTEKLDKTIRSEKGQALLKDLVKTRKAYNVVTEKVMALGLDNKNAEGYMLLTGEVRVLQNEYFGAVNELIKYQTQLVEEGAIEATAIYNSARMLMIVFSVSAAIIGIGMAIFITRSITVPVRKGVQLAEEIAKGNFSLRLNSHSRDEIGQLSNALDTMSDGLQKTANLADQIAAGNLDVEVRLASDKDQLGQALVKMTTNLNEVLGEIRNGSEEIASASGQVADSSQSLSQGATEQAASLEEISASLNQTSAQTTLNAENSAQANNLSVETRTAAEQGSAQMQQMVSAMAEINEAGQNISKIIKTIDEIAFQTNLLALNAAVEAARAGQHGKGFAVVAEEVRNLAARSAKAAAETAELIEGSVAKTENGSQIAEHTAEALQEIVIGVGRVSDLVAEIAAASSEQAQGIAEINQGITQIDTVTQQNTANAEESAAASEEMSAQAEQLRQMLLRFTLRQGSQTRSPHFVGKSKTEASDHTVMARDETRLLSGQAQIALDDSDFGKY
ncbi:methyl-accepting chemotaxis protein [uncultured Desulfuromusa sp.]|uniref:methyl-accepting chemotaxis protein n=1 Tax=uncultured Desulfuromusa sp. TaxID=219183 RepID=UPI002AA88BBD|nr:methyl-accepting chemotaxis protein [uncultured Desulfuromusa sp.]